MIKELLARVLPKGRLRPDRVEPVIVRPRIQISGDALALSKLKPKTKEPIQVFRLPTYAPGVIPKSEQARFAMDDAAWQQTNQGAFNTWASSMHGTWAEGIGFMGYPYLAELTQRTEYRRPSEVIAEEMTRKWIKITAVGDDKTEKVKQLTKSMKRFQLRDKMRHALELDGYMGLSMIYVDTGSTDDRDELKMPLLRVPAKIPKGGLKAFTVIDPTWVAPNNYNSSDPLQPNYYRPSTWFVMGKEVNSSRLLTICSRPVPDLLKPAYNFGGVSLSQMMKPYVDNWLETRQGVTDLVLSFTVFVLETQMASVLQGEGAAAFFERLDMFVNTRNNRGVLAIDKNAEGFQNVSAPLGTLDALQAQAQEHQSSASAIPLVKAFGITPSGLNASTDGEIRVFYDSVHARQEKVLDPILTDALDILQLHEFGEIDPEITYEWIPLWQLDDAGKAAVRKTNADTDAVLSGVGAIGPEDIRKRVANEVDSLYPGLDPLDLPPPPEMPEGASLNDPSETIVKQGEEGSESGANSGDRSLNSRLTLDQATLTKESVHYQKRSTHDDEICDDCENYLGGNRCKHVMGYIDPEGWCSHWTAET